MCHFESAAGFILEVFRFGDFNFFVAVVVILTNSKIIFS